MFEAFCAQDGIKRRIVKGKSRRLADDRHIGCGIHVIAFVVARIKQEAIGSVDVPGSYVKNSAVSEVGGEEGLAKECEPSGLVVHTLSGTDSSKSV